MSEKQPPSDFMIIALGDDGFYYVIALRPLGNVVLDGPYQIKEFAEIAMRRRAGRP